MLKPEEFKSAGPARKLEMLRTHREEGREILKGLADSGDLLGFLDVAVAMDRIDTYLFVLEKELHNAPEQVPL